PEVGEVRLVLGPVVDDAERHAQRLMLLHLVVEVAHDFRDLAYSDRTRDILHRLIISRHELFAATGRALPRCRRAPTLRRSRFWQRRTRWRRGKPPLR